MRNNRENKEHSKRNIDRTGNPRYRLTEDQADILLDYRRIKDEAYIADGLKINTLHFILKTTQTKKTKTNS